MAAFLRGVAAPDDLPALLHANTGLAVNLWHSRFNLDPDTFRFNLLANAVIGRYDGRMSATIGSALASEGDPSSTFISASFALAINEHLRSGLRYTTSSAYVLISNAIDTWDFSHDGNAVPDTIPDLGAALAQNPRLRVLAMNGFDDLATPFHQTELDLARLGPNPQIKVRNYVGGRMTYLYDVSRPLQKVDLVAFYAVALAAQANWAGEAR